METAILKKRLSTFKSSKGTLSRVSDEVIVDVLKNWESWEGSTVQFSREIGISRQQLAIIIKKGKKLVKDGVMTESEFKQIGVSQPSLGSLNCSNSGILIKFEKKLIRFSQVDQLVDFLNKVKAAA